MRSDRVVTGRFSATSSSGVGETASGQPPQLARGTNLRDHDLARMRQVAHHPEFLRMSELGLYAPPASAYDLAAVMTGVGILAAVSALAALGLSTVGVLAALAGVAWAAAGVGFGRQTYHRRALVVRSVAMFEGAFDPNPAGGAEVRIRLRLATGAAHAVVTTAGLAQALTAGDVGLAFLREGQLLAFWRVNAGRRVPFQRYLQGAVAARPSHTGYGRD